MATYRIRKTSSGEVRHQVQIRRKGYPLITETFATKKEAQKWAMKTEAAILDGLYYKPTLEISSMGDLIELYICEFIPGKECSEASKKNQKQRFLWWKQEIGGMKPSDLRPKVLNKYRDILSNKRNHTGGTYSADTVNCYLGALSHVFTIAMKDWELVEDNPVWFHHRSSLRSKPLPKI